MGYSPETKPEIQPLYIANIKRFIDGFYKKGLMKQNHTNILNGDWYTELISPPTLDLESGRFVRTHYTIEKFTQEGEYQINAFTPSRNVEDGDYILWYALYIDREGYDVEMTKKKDGNFLNIDGDELEYPSDTSPEQEGLTGKEEVYGDEVSSKELSILLKHLKSSKRITSIQERVLDLR